MTDITELAQSLKAAANTTADAIDRLEAFPGDELIDLSQHEGEQVDIDITTLNEWYELSSPANVLALVEALEKAQDTITEMDNRIRKQNRHVCELFDDNTALRQRIAELESRTVKLPDLRQIVSGDRYVWSDGVYNYSQDVKVALADAGIKVEAE
ncbi:TPA: ead/Ea22-like family protein [Klebsiella quasipneumoniae]|nr:ead/Ea22-like family protein [Klebsiella quasipneumoniae]